MSQQGRHPSFGQLVRSFRRRARMTQETLAERAALSVRGVRNLEADRVAAPRASSLDGLLDALDLDDDERRRLVAAALGDDRPGDDRSNGPDRRLSARPIVLSSFVGRDADVVAVTQRLIEAKPRLLTLTGIAGIGKTRLALAVADELQRRGVDVWWVSLAAVDDTSYVLDAIAAVTGAPDATVDAIVTSIDGRDGVLVLDNVEHLDGFGAVMTEVAGRLPTVVTLATSMAPVGVTGEHEWPVGALNAPVEGADHDVASIASNPSVTLLVDRIASVDASFTFGDADADVIAEICRRLDGIPLALELAAAQWRVRGGAGVLGAIDDDPLGLTDVRGQHGATHASVRHALEGSYRLLTASAQDMFHDLSVFRGGWTIDAVADVTASDDLLDHLDRMLSLGLIAVHDDDLGRRFTMLPVVRAFAASKADDDGVSMVAAKRHAAHFRVLVASLDDDAAQPARLQALDADVHNIRAALQWFLDNDAGAGLEMATSAYRYFSRREGGHEILGWLDRFLAAAGDVEIRAHALMLAANTAYKLGLGDRAMRLAEESLTASRKRDDALDTARALGTLGMIVPSPDAVGYLLEAVEQAREVGHAYTELWCLTNLGASYSNVGDFSNALTAVDQAIELARIHRHPYAEAFQLISRAAALFMMNDVTTALDVLEGLDDHDAVHDDGELVGRRSAWMAVCLARVGDARRADELANLALESALPTRQPGVIAFAHVASGEAHLARGDSSRACEQFRAALVQQGARQGFDNVHAAAGLAVATDDRRVAAVAIAIARDRAATVTTTLPGFIADRLGQVDRRWSASSPDQWEREITEASRQQIDRMLHQLRLDAVDRPLGADGSG